MRHVDEAYLQISSPSAHWAWSRILWQRARSVPQVPWASICGTSTPSPTRPCPRSCAKQSSSTPGLASHYYQSSSLEGCESRPVRNPFGTKRGATTGAFMRVDSNDHWFIIFKVQDRWTKVSTLRMGELLAPIQLYIRKTCNKRTQFRVF